MEKATMVREFTVGVSKTVNLGNFNSIRVEASLTVAVPENNLGAVEDLKQAALLDLKRLLEDNYKTQLKHGATANE
jgi:hypothetical protein